MTLSHTVPLRAADGHFVEAVLYERIDTEYAQQADTDWRAYLAVEKARAMTEGREIPRFEHSHWEWEAKVKASAHLLSFPTLAIECAGQTQGLMLLQTDGYFCRLPSDTGKPMVYVVYLATAPWNLRALIGHPRYAGVGFVFLHAAIQMSIDNGFKGRIGLHSLPQAEAFYEKHGFLCLGADPEKEGLKYYELTPQAAHEFIIGSTS